MSVIDICVIFMIKYINDLAAVENRCEQLAVLFFIGGGMSFEVSVRAKLAAAFDIGTLKLTSWIRLLYGLRLSQATQTA